MKTVELYTKPACIPCRVTKRELDKAGIPYTEKPAEAYADFLKQLGAYAAPVVIIYHDGQAVEWWCSFRKDRVDALAKTWWELQGGGAA